MQDDLKIVQFQQLSHLLAMLQILLWILFITYILGPLEPLPVFPTATSIPSAWYLPLNGHYLQGGYTAGLSFIEIFYSLHFHSGCIFRKIIGKLTFQVMIQITVEIASVPNTEIFIITSKTRLGVCSEAKLYNGFKRDTSI